MIGAVATLLQLLRDGWWRAVVGAAVAAGPAFTLGRCSVDVGAAVIASGDAAAVKAGGQDRAADDNAARQRRRDDASVAAASTAVENATSDLAPSPTSARQRARACELLRQQGAAAPALTAAGC